MDPRSQISSKKTAPKDEKRKLLKIKKRRKAKEILQCIHFPKHFMRKFVSKVTNNHAGLSHNGKCILNSLVNDVFERLTAQAFKLQRVAKRKTLTHHDVAAACTLVLSGNLLNRARAAGTKAVIEYLRSYTK